MSIGHMGNMDYRSYGDVLNILYPGAFLNPKVTLSTLSPRTCLHYLDSEGLSSTQLHPAPPPPRPLPRPLPPHPPPPAPPPPLPPLRRHAPRGGTANSIDFSARSSRFCKLGALTIQPAYLFEAASQCPLSLNSRDPNSPMQVKLADHSGPM